MSAETDGTLLVITPLYVASALTLTPYSARGLTQTLQPIAGTGGRGGAMGSWIRESTNGVLIDLTYAPFRKYESTVTCRDQQTPCLDNAWLGQICLVSCACELNYLTATGSPHRSEVSGSSRTEGNFTFYRPILTMMVTEINSDFREWEAEYEWQIHLRELAAP